MSQRIDRINELLKREISSVVDKSFEFPESLVTIHAVDTAADLKAAKIYVGVVGAAEKDGSVVEKLNAKHGFIQNAVMKRVVLRYTPQFTFVADTSIERGVRVLNILEEIGEIDLPEETENPDDRKI
ncbi:MAG: 30S ribosome-binding factor RbfA [Verrucomicrobiales bacterium]|jgi:ribosome-binding factor A|nr:30S ribosome-binding factor RbfA [Verrucomicrobiales bacterium]